jgi:hypothetical protein
VPRQGEVGHGDRDRHSSAAPVLVPPAAWQTRRESNPATRCPRGNHPGQRERRSSGRCETSADAAPREGHARRTGTARHALAGPVVRGSAE